VRNNTRYLGLDVHAATIAVAIAEGRGEVRSLGTIENRPEAVARLLKKLGNLSTLHVCYEAGPTGYVLYWQLTKLGVHCEVIAPSLVPVKAGDRIKTDRRDAEKLARALRAGDLTSVFVPSAEHEALRDLVRAREAAKTDELRARHRLSKYLLRCGKYPPAEGRAWSLAYWRWLKTVKFEHSAQNVVLLECIVEVEHQGARIQRLDKAIDDAIAGAPRELKAVIEALQSLRGVAKITAVTVAVEVGTFQRFERATQLMSYTGIVPSERSSGLRERRGAITKAGNSHMRRVLIEAAHHYRHQPRLSARQRALQRELDPRVLEIAWKAQLRLSRRYTQLSSKSKPVAKVVTAVARELVGFVWAIGRAVEDQPMHKTRTAA
jgi:transposase